MATILAFRNVCKTGVITANSQAPNMPPSNLSGDICAPSMGWQTKAGDVTSPAALLKIQSLLPATAWRIFGLFRTNLTANATVIFTTWISVGGGAPTATWTTTLAGPPVGYGQVVAIAPSDQVADFVQIQINDSTNPEGFINVGGAYAGPAWFPQSGISWASTMGREDVTVRNTTRGGQEYPILQWQRRKWDVGFDGIRTSETWSQVDILRRTSRTGSNVLFVPNHASADLQYEATFGILQDTADISFPGKSADRRAWRATITERL